MAKLSELVGKAQKSTKPQFKDKTTTEIADILYSQQSKQLSDTRQQLRQVRTTQDKRLDIVLNLMPDGTLALNQTAMQNGVQMNGKRTLMKSEALSKMANALRPLLGLARAVVKANGVIKNQPLHELDKEGKRTGQVKKMGGEVVYNSDPLSQLKHLCYIIEHNQDAMRALNTLQEALKECTTENLKSLAVTEKAIQSSEPIRLEARNDEPSEDTPSPKA